MSAEECALRITERIWLRAFGTTPKFPFRELQIRSGRYVNIFIASVSLSSPMYLEIPLPQLLRPQFILSYPHIRLLRKLLQARIHLIQHPPYRFRAHKFYIPTTHLMLNTISRQFIIKRIILQPNTFTQYVSSISPYTHHNQAMVSQSSYRTCSLSLHLLHQACSLPQSPARTSYRSLLN